MKGRVQLLGVCAGTFMLVTSAHASEPAPAPAGAPAQEKLICKALQETGSLVKKKRKCFTRAQWERLAEAARINGQRMTSDHAAGMVSN